MGEGRGGGGSWPFAAADVPNIETSLSKHSIPSQRRVARVNPLANGAASGRRSRRCDLRRHAASRSQRPGESVGGAHLRAARSPVVISMRVRLEDVWKVNITLQTHTALRRHDKMDRGTFNHAGIFTSVYLPWKKKRGHYKLLTHACLSLEIDLAEGNLILVFLLQCTQAPFGLFKVTFLFFAPLFFSLNTFVFRQ